MPEGPLPTLMACLNTASTLCLLAGYLFIKQKKVTLHKRAMLTAFGISACFLVTYVLHHALEGDVRFRGQGVWRTVYFAILIPHVILAISVLPLAIVTIRRGLRGEIAKHRPLARVTLPIWLYVSVTGVMVYAMLYRLGF
jgi:putative membrane protein